MPLIYFKIYLFLYFWKIYLFIMMSILITELLFGVFMSDPNWSNTLMLCASYEVI